MAVDANHNENASARAIIMYYGGVPTSIKPADDTNRHSVDTASVLGLELCL